MSQGFFFTKPACSDGIPPLRLCHLNVLKYHNQLGPRVQVTETNYGVHSSIKSTTRPTKLLEFS